MVTSVSDPLRQQTRSSLLLLKLVAPDAGTGPFFQVQLFSGLFTQCLMCVHVHTATPYVHPILPQHEPRPLGKVRCSKQYRYVGSTTPSLLRAVRTTGCVRHGNNGLAANGQRSIFNGGGQRPQRFSLHPTANGRHASAFGCAQVTK